MSYWVAFWLKIKVFWKCWAHDTTKKTWIIQYKAAESFGWMVLIDLMCSRVYLYRLRATVRAHFWNHLFTVQERWKKKNKFKRLRVSNWYTKHNFPVKYHFKIQVTHHVANHEAKFLSAFTLVSACCQNNKVQRSISKIPQSGISAATFS